MRTYYRIKGVRYREEDLAAFKPLRGRRVVFVSNHVDRRDAIVAFYLSKLLRERFYYMSNREQLSEGTLYTWLLRSCGVYSIARGLPDVASIKYTTRLLSGDESNRLFLFPEGGAFSRNDTAFPFLVQPFEIILRSAKALAKSKPDDAIFVIPVALRYEYDNVDKDIAASLSGLESAVGIPISTRDTDFAKRIVSVGTAVVESFDRIFDLGLESDESNVNEKGLRIKRHIVESIRSYLDLVGGKEMHREASAERSDLDEARATLNELYARHQSAKLDEESLPRSDYEKLLRQQMFDRMSRVYEEAKRLENWIALDAQYFRERVTTNRIIDTVIRLEREVFGEVRWSAERVCALRLGKPVDTREHSSAQALADHCLSQIVDLLGEETTDN